MIWRTISVWRIPNGNRNVPELNWNDSNRKLNLNNWNGDWNGNYRFAGVRNFLFSSGLDRRSFLRELFSPASKHFANFIQRFRQKCILLVIKIFMLPGDLQEEIQKI